MKKMDQKQKQEYPVNQNYPLDKIYSFKSANIVAISILLPKSAEQKEVLLTKAIIR